MTNAIFINPTLRSIILVEIDGLKDMQKMVDGYIAGVGYIQPDGTVGDDPDDFIYVNDEGLFDETTDFVKIKGYAQEYYRGNMLIVGSDGKGGTTDVKMTVNQAKAFIQMIPKERITVNL